MTPSRKVKLFPGVILIGVGTVLLVMCVFATLNTRRFVREAAAADGMVVRLNAGGSHPEIEFTTRPGEKIFYPQGGWIHGFKVGDRVRVLYRPEDPHRTACVDRPGAIWDWAGFSGGLGLLQLIVGIVALYRPQG